MIAYQHVLLLMLFLYVCCLSLLATLFFQVGMAASSLQSAPDDVVILAMRLSIHYVLFVFSVFTFIPESTFVH